MEAYTFAQLPENTPHIRLITLFPDQDPASPLICTVWTVPLPSQRTYTALSYCWGDPKPTDVLTMLPGVICSNEEDPATEPWQWQSSLRIAHNLSAALHHIRDPFEMRTLWVDAICINQQDNKEKSLQIPLMTQIYGGAAEVIAWIGEAGETGDVAMDAVVTLSNEFRKARDVDQGKIDPTSKEAARMDHEVAFAYAERFLTLLSRPFFRRVWIVQEIGKGGRRAVIQCGARKATWDQLAEASVLASVIGNQVYSPLLVEFVILIDAARGLEASDLFFRQAAESRSLLSLLCRYRRFNATDPRDKVFALLNLTNDEVATDRRVIPDYDKTVSQVYTDVAVAIMEHEKNLEILRVPRPSICKPEIGGTSPCHQLPSWAPDWSPRHPAMTTDITGLRDNSQFHPTPQVAEEEIPLRLSDDGTTLTVRSVVCPVKIRSIGPAIERADSLPEKIPSLGELLKHTRTEGETLLAWEDMAGAHPAHWSRPYPCSNARARRDHGEGGTCTETIGEAYRRTLLFGREYRGEDGSEICDADFRAWAHNRLGTHLRIPRRLGLLRFSLVYRISLYLSMVFRTIFCRWKIHQEEYAGVSRFGDELALYTVGRRFFITDDGLFGMGPEALEKGDRIMLVKGAGMPIVVRPVPGTGCWSVIGDCYVHSDKIMSGVAWSEGIEEALNLV